MPKVTFVNEHRTVEVASGRRISDVAKELGIAVCREAFVGTGIGNYTVWVKGAPDCLTPPGFLERLGGARGDKRFANRARILADCEIFTQGGLADRLRAPRPITAPPRPSDDPKAGRLGPSSTGTSAFPYGHPAEVGKGTRPAVPRGGSAEESDEGAPKAKATAAAAVAAATAEGAAPAAAGDAAAEKAARMAEKKARQAALKARLAGGDAAAPAADATATEPKAEAAAEPAAAEAPAAPAAPAAAAKPIDAEKAARIAEKKARQAELKARLAAGADKPKPPEGEGGGAS